MDDKASILNAYREYADQGEKKVDKLKDKKRSTWKYEISMVNELGSLLLNKLTLPVSKENKWDII